ncbi:MAG: nucleoside monophosphate kinase [Candidatus Dependentiae bacterium]|nr:nucleoside monophosphate kinase [Candidatus Dependentiae bacterium]
MNSKTDVIILIGPPGAGKGSLANLCIKNLGWKQLSTGNLCRKHIAEQTEIGKQIDFAIKSGKLVSDSLMTGVVDEWLSSQIGRVPAVILDGFPRTVAQAKALGEYLKDKESHLKLTVVKLFISHEKVIARLCNRYICSNIECQAIYSLSTGSTLVPQKEMICDTCGNPLTKRKDDEEEAIVERLQIYRKHEQDLLNFYINAQHAVTECNVERSLNEIFEDFKRLMGIGLKAG